MMHGEPPFEKLILMIRIEDKGVYYIEVFGVPAFPAHLEAAAEIRELAGEDEAEIFVKWWDHGCVSRGFTHDGKLLPEELVHARRLLARHTLTRLQDYAVDFWIEYAKPNMRGVTLMRVFVSVIPMIEAQWKQT